MGDFRINPSLGTVQTQIASSKLLNDARQPSPLLPAPAAARGQRPAALRGPERRERHRAGHRDRHRHPASQRPGPRPRARTGPLGPLAPRSPGRRGSLILAPGAAPE